MIDVKLFDGVEGLKSQLMGWKLFLMLTEKNLNRKPESQYWKFGSGHLVEVQRH